MVDNITNQPIQLFETLPPREMINDIPLSGRVFYRSTPIHEHALTSALNTFKDAHNVEFMDTTTGARLAVSLPARGEPRWQRVSMGTLVRALELEALLSNYGGQPFEVTEEQAPYGAGSK